MVYLAQNQLTKCVELKAFSFDNWRARALIRKLINNKKKHYGRSTTNFSKD